ncbi:hypothetical protein WR25_19801 isoform G [Diploscapter pachys]|uniref:serine C-palmitoyltransferase n=1 Tax=Diploscapter pachys TaxID=2018661 RepID=A0A2A2KWI4_9BILA|nr:hypothetical protein WR25_19801 isoform A [Diploscapter pachys]PAV78308.1 hypothetical protein WR25_19801 isoform E [Diploscapter pachys]PAV78310.1 hypothetical protein WR25_19801 isoform G [Diploscapter pachys]
MEGGLETELSPLASPAERRTAFRIFHRLPFRLETRKSPSKPLTDELCNEEEHNKTTETVDDEKFEADNDDESRNGQRKEEAQLNGQLVERTDILECAWHRRQEEADDAELQAALESEEEQERKVALGTGSASASQADLGEKIDIYGNVSKRAPNDFEHISTFTLLSVYFSWMMLLLFAYLREILKRIGIEDDKSNKERPELKNFTPLFSDFESLYQRNCYIRVRDVFERPIASVPGATVDIIDRISYDGNWTYVHPGSKTNVINIGSYNYLGFAQSSGPCAEAAAESIDREGVAMCTTVHERGRSVSQHRLEKLVAEFLGVEDAICFSMGFATNSMNAPCLVDKHSLIISDQFNHASLILGCRLSGASTKVFKHNDMKSLEKILRDAIAYGNPKTHRPYKKILIIVEGIYSMEGSICNLPGIIALKKKYKAYLYLDEAHSIGAMGKSGRGMVEYWGCNPKDVDILMGTFTKSFGSSGGYIAGSKHVINHLRVSSPTGYYSSPMSPPIAQQIYTSMSIIMGRDGTTDGSLIHFLSGIER